MWWIGAEISAERNEIVAVENKFEIGFHILEQWLYLRQSGKFLDSYFKDNMIESVAIYGMGVLGERLYKELLDSDISIVYGIDRAADSKRIMGLEIFNTGEHKLPNADAIVVTPVQDYWRIVELLEHKTDAAVVSLEDIVEYCVVGEMDE